MYVHVLLNVNPMVKRKDNFQAVVNRLKKRQTKIDFSLTEDT